MPPSNIIELPELRDTTRVFHDRADAGQRLAKRHDSKAIRKFRDEGASPEDIRRMVGL